MTTTPLRAHQLPGVGSTVGDNLTTKLATTDSRLDAAELRGAKIYKIVDAAAKSTTAVHALIDSTSTDLVTTDITNPDVPRNLRVVKASSWDGGTVTVFGTDFNDIPISEVFPVLTAGTEVGTKIFKTVTGMQHSIALDGGNGYSVGTGDLLGLPSIPTSTVHYLHLKDATPEDATLDTTYGGFTPTTAPDASLDFTLIYS